MALINAGNRSKTRKTDTTPSPQPTKTLETLLEELDSDDVGLRRRAARDLADFPEAVPALCLRVATETALSVRTVLFTALIRMRSPSVVAGLVPYLRSEDAGLRNAVIEALQDMPEEVAPVMDELLADPDNDARIFAVNILSALPHANAPHWLVQVIDTDPHVNVCAAAVDCLAEVGDIAAVPHLENLSRRFADHPFMQFAVTTAIRRINGE
ncbi:HEAT repeat domain-containing protein [Magnetospirillum molischianum]|uniref:PBS lyase HEAT-like repeat n=1 Tax=Magnetospirillum molischianum DSM 120 TaxID=1150626 RepID=H8FVF8_MAGML|nr:HEAT repeat domain-containing protein [Magnetospirillum molischianum]CCG42346.1 PBS lyase HEAT-like repeat [Magnetospirillum molischianum DSM 120]